VAPGRLQRPVTAPADPQLGDQASGPDRVRDPDRPEHHLPEPVVQPHRDVHARLERHQLEDLRDPVALPQPVRARAQHPGAAAAAVVDQVVAVRRHPQLAQPPEQALRGGGGADGTEQVTGGVRQHVVDRVAGSHLVRRGPQFIGMTAAAVMPAR
jgi:hypothetical protein